MLITCDAGHRQRHVPDARCPSACTARPIACATWSTSVMLLLDDGVLRHRLDGVALDAVMLAASG
ncbi:MAG: hypothetical protein MZV65_54180 [Chromatiales bacterium]|nr:hypothetical protein [Chromatiales bacterium]